MPNNSLCHSSTTQKDKIRLYFDCILPLCVSVLIPAVCIPHNPEEHQFGANCGQKLLLRERYWAKEILGQGSFGQTFLAVDEDKPSKPFCVIKQFLPQAQGTDSLEKAAALFAQEAEQLGQLGYHPQIPELLAYFTDNGQQYLVQEFVNGATLAQELAENGVFFFSRIQTCRL